MSGNDGRPIKDMKGLLKFCMGATQNEDAPNASSCETMSEERKQWLEEALTSMSVEPVKRLSACLKTIDDAEDDTEEGTEQQLTALMEITEWVENFDLAIGRALSEKTTLLETKCLNEITHSQKQDENFVKINGMRIVPRLLSSEVSELRWNCLEVIATMCQNNPQVQKSVLDLQLLPVFLELVRADPNPTVRIKAMYALSCLVRSNDLAQKELVANDGLITLGDTLEGDEDKLKLKAIFLISAMCQSNPVLKDAFLDKGIVKQMVAVLKGEHCDSHEHLMSALLSLVSNHAPTKQFCLQENLDLKSFLVQRINYLEGKEEFQEERTYAGELLTALNASSTHSARSSSSQTALVPV